MSTLYMIALVTKVYASEEDARKHVESMNSCDSTYLLVPVEIAPLNGQAIVDHVVRQVDAAIGK